MDDDGKVVEWMKWMQLGSIYSESGFVRSQRGIFNFWYNEH